MTDSALSSRLRSRLFKTLGAVHGLNLISRGGLMTRDGKGE
jgi:hypothetical protein